MPGYETQMLCVLIISSLSAGSVRYEFMATLSLNGLHQIENIRLKIHSYKSIINWPMKNKRCCIIKVNVIFFKFWASTAAPIRNAKITV
jgi:hypothetical protein